METDVMVATARGDIPGLVREGEEGGEMETGLGAGTVRGLWTWSKASSMICTTIDLQLSVIECVVRSVLLTLLTDSVDLFLFSVLELGTALTDRRCDDEYEEDDEDEENEDEEEWLSGRSGDLGAEKETTEEEEEN